MNAYVGIDLHSNNSYVGIIDEKDNRLFLRKLPNNLEQILLALEQYREKNNRNCSRINIQLVLVSRWIGIKWLQSSFVKSLCE